MRRSIAHPHQQALAERIGYLVDNPTEARRLGRTGREVAEREFSPERTARETVAVYRRVLAEG